MQLKKSALPVYRLSAATVALLGATVDADEGSETDSWDFDSALLVYNEADRVTTVEAIFSAVNEYDDDHFLSYKITLDSLTGASANGAVAQPVVQTFTRPSGNGQYTISAGETPLDDTFLDTRFQLNVQWDVPFEDAYSLSTGVHFSREYDYTSAGFNAGLSKDLFQKNTTLSVGFSYSFDLIDPEGGRPVGLSSMVIDEGQFANEAAFDAAFYLTRQSGDDNKTVSDILLGMTQVINRRMLMQFNYSWSNSEGYLTDPFKVLSIVDATGITQDLVYERRPDSRTKQSIFWQTKYHFAEAGFFDNVIADVSYRYMWDDWEIDSSTIDLRLLFPLSNGDSIEPHFRYYTQQAAEFYHPFLNQPNPTPEFASADYRIGELDGITLGLKYVYRIDSEHDLSLRLEYYQQTSSDAGFSAVGALQNLDITPGLDAVFLQFGYSF